MNRFRDQRAQPPISLRNPRSSFYPVHFRRPPTNMPSPECENRSSSPLHDYPVWRPSIHDNPFPSEPPIPASEPPKDAGCPEGSSSTTLVPKMSYARSSNFETPGLVFRSPIWSVGAGIPLTPPYSMAGPHQTPALPPPPFSHLEAAETLTGLAQTTLPSEPSTVEITTPIVPFHAQHHQQQQQQQRGLISNQSSPPVLSLMIMSPNRSHTSGSGTTPPLSAGDHTVSQSQSPSPKSPTSSLRFESFSSQVPRLPPILQVEKTVVTTTATQAASAQRRRNDAAFKCPVPGCGSTFTRRFNLRGASRLSDLHSVFVYLSDFSVHFYRSLEVAHRGEAVHLRVA